MALKTYTLGNNGFVYDAVTDALGMRSNRQARVLIAAATKKAALEMLSQTPHIYTPKVGDSEFRQAAGNDVDALRAAGMFDQPGIFVTNDYGPGSDKVVMVDGDRVELAGRFVGFRDKAFEPVEG